MRRLGSRLALGALALVALTLAAPAPAGALDGPERALIGAVNAMRAESGLAPLRYEPRLAQIAQAYARASLRAAAPGARGDDPDLAVADRLADNAYPFRAMRVFAESGTSDPTAQARAWLADAQTRSPLLDRAFQEIGVGRVDPRLAGPGSAAAAGGGRASPAGEDPGVVWSVLLAAPTWPAPAGWGERVLAYVNEFRAREGLIPLTRNDALDQAAQAHAQDMARRDFFAHRSPSGEGPAERVDRTGYHWTRVLENLAAGQPTAREVVDGWIRSTAGHREAMLDKTVRELGVGYHYLPRDRGRVAAHHYWALTLAAPR